MADAKEAISFFNGSTETKKQTVMKTNNSIIKSPLSGRFYAALLCAAMVIAPFTVQARGGGGHGGGHGRGFGGHEGGFGRRDGGFGRHDDGFRMREPDFGWSGPGFGWNDPGFGWSDDGFQLGHERHDRRR